MMMRKLRQAALFAVASLMVLAVACKKDVSSNTGSSSTSTVAESVIAVATSATGEDSVYVIQHCDRGQHRDTVSQSALPGSITTYLTTNYAGYTFAKAFAVKDSSGNVANYVVIVYYNSKPVALLFTAQGSFVKVLEQREKGDLDGDGWHKGGRFGNRDSLHKDTVALTALPSAITSYMATNYPGDTLLKAARTEDSGYVVISANNGLYATVFNSSGSFVSHTQLPQPHGKPQPVAQSSLPASALTYLSTTYPNYVFEKAFAFSANGTVKGYVVLIDASGTKYAVAFDAGGTFIGAIPVW